MPRVVSGDSMPVSAAGAKLMGDELGKQTKSAATTLLVVGIIQIVVGAVLVGLLLSIKRPPSAVNLPVVVASTIGLGIIFIGLHMWARWSPLPATIVGLVIYSTLVLLNMISSIGRMSSSGTPGSGIGGLGIGWLDIIIVAILCRGIGAALKSRKLSATPTA